MHPLAPHPRWLEQLQARADCAPLRARVPVAWNGIEIGTAEAGVLQRVAGKTLRERDGGFQILGELTSALADVAHALHAEGFVRAWRNEQLAVRGARGEKLGTVERGVVRLLGIAVEAVHLLGVDPEGRHWLQQRAYDKPDDPGLWDTLMGGTIGAAESVQDTLARETWEEAGLRLEQLQALEPGGTLVTRRPSASVPHGYIVEKLTWYRCVVPHGVAPANVDGEVAQFKCMPPADVRERLERLEFTIDAALMLVQA